MHGLKALSLANALVPQHELVRRERTPSRKRASWARKLVRVAIRRPEPSPAPRVRSPRPTA